MSSPPNSVLLLIDIQDGLTHPTYWGPSRSNPSFERNAAQLLETYRKLVSATTTSLGSSPHKVIHVGHSSTSPASPLRPELPGHKFQDFAAPKDGEAVVYKNVNSGFIGTDLEKIIRAHGTRKLWVAGLTTDHCVSTTVRMAGNLGVCNDDAAGEQGEVIMVGDATAAWKKSESGWDAETVHAVHLESLTEFATIAKTDDVLALWNSWIHRGWSLRRIFRSCRWFGYRDKTELFFVGIQLVQ
ncbi:Isochorismatase-like protein [Xylogone sp. PMI_703]|nr:Isochorismatase-like protein [Xylogone sp. PMI_703]